MINKIIDKATVIIPSIVDNHYVFVVLSVISFLLGGIDDALVVMFVLNATDIVLHLISSKQDTLLTIKRKLKVLIVIMLGTFIDMLLGNNSDISIRKYFILAYSYNEIVCIVNLLKEDNGFFIPTKVNEIMEKIKRGGKF